MTTKCLILCSCFSFAEDWNFAASAAASSSRSFAALIHSLACFSSSFWSLNSAFQSAVRICPASVSRRSVSAAIAFSVSVYVVSPAVLLASAPVEAVSVSAENGPSGALIALYAAPRSSTVPWCSFSDFATASSFRNSVTTRPSDSYVSFRPTSARIVGRTSAWSVQTLSVSCFFSMPGPTQPIHVLTTSGWMPPWFHANELHWVAPAGGVQPGGEVAGRNTQFDRSLFAHGVVEEALRK